MPNSIFPSTHTATAESIVQFVECLNGKVLSFDGNERRRHARFVVAIPSFVRCLNENQEPEGKSFHAVTRDISIGGIALIHSQPVTSRFIWVSLLESNRDAFDVTVEVVRCQPLGPYFDIGGRFVTGDPGTPVAG